MTEYLFFCFRLNRYTADNRNLFRVTDYPRRKERLQLGKRNIVEYLSKLPKSQHDLSSFAVDLSLFTVGFSPLNSDLNEQTNKTNKKRLYLSCSLF